MYFVAIGRLWAVDSTDRRNRATTAMRHPSTAVLAIVLAMTLQIALVNATAADTCDDQKGEAYGLCIAAESIPCNLETASSPECESLADAFREIAQGFPPWLEEAAEGICPCQFEIDRLVKQLKDDAIGIEGECLIGQLTANVPVPDSLGIQIIATGVTQSASILIGAYSYRDSEPGSGQCEVDAALGVDQRISTALMVTKAEQEQCQRAIATLTTELNISCLDRGDGS